MSETPIGEDKMEDAFAKLTIKFKTRESAEKALNPFFKMLIEEQYDDVEYELEVALE